jgi:hypothetical protein
MGIEVGTIGVRPMLDERRPPQNFSVKVSYKIHNYGSSPALRVANSFVLAPDTGPDVLPNEFSCKEATRISGARFEIAASVLPSQTIDQARQIDGLGITQPFPNTIGPNVSINTGVIGCIAYIGIADSEIHTTTIKILFRIVRDSKDQVSVEDMRISYEDAQ